MGRSGPSRRLRTTTRKLDDQYDDQQPPELSPAELARQERYRCWESLAQPGDEDFEVEPLFGPPRHPRKQPEPEPEPTKKTDDEKTDDEKKDARKRLSIQELLGLGDSPEDQQKLQDYYDYVETDNGLKKPRTAPATALPTEPYVAPPTPVTHGRFTGLEPPRPAPRDIELPRDQPMPTPEPWIAPPTPKTHGRFTGLEPPRPVPHDIELPRDQPPGSPRWRRRWCPRPAQSLPIPHAARGTQCGLGDLPTGAGTDIVPPRGDRAIGSASSHPLPSTRGTPARARTARRRDWGASDRWHGPMGASRRSCRSAWTSTARKPRSRRSSRR